MIQFDYDTILAALKDNLSQIMEDADISGYSSAQRILEPVAEEMQSITGYMEYLTRESKWSVCQNLSSILTQAGMFGYRVHRKKGSVGTLTVSTSSTFDSSYSNTITIPRFTEFTGGDLTFVSSAETVLTSSSVSVDVPIVQGILNTYTETVSSTRDKELMNYSVHLAYDSIEDQNLRVVVNGIEFTELDTFAKYDGSSFARNTAYSKADGTGSFYVVKNDSDMGGISIVFGDGLSATRLNNGDVITISYLITEGEDGNILYSDVVNKVVSTVVDSSGLSVDLYCRNKESITGGSDIETIEEVRASAPQKFRSGDLVITLKDYASAIKDVISSNSLVSVWGWSEEMEDAGLPPSNYSFDFSDTDYEELNKNLYGSNRVYVCGVTLSSNVASALSASERKLIYDSLTEKPLTDSLWFVDPIVTYFKIRVRVFYDSSKYLESSVVSNDVRSTLLEEYALNNVGVTRTSGRTLAFKNSLYASEYTSIIHDVSSVSYSNADIRLFQIRDFDNTETSEGLTIASLDLMHSSLRSGSIFIYVKSKSKTEGSWVLFAMDHKDVGKTEGYFVTLPTAVENRYITYNTGDTTPLTHLESLYRDITISVSSTATTEYLNYKTGAFDNTKAMSQDTGVTITLHANTVGATPVAVGGTGYEYRIEFVPDQTQPDIVLNSRRQIMGISSGDISILTYKTGAVVDSSEDWNDVWDGQGIDEET